MKKRVYPVRGIASAAVASVVTADMHAAGYEARAKPLAKPHVGTFVEVRRPSGVVQQTTGQGAALNVWVLESTEGLEVQVGTGRWGDKAAGAVEWLLATPMLVTEGYAAFQQAQLDERVFRVVEQYLASVSGAPMNRVPAPVPSAGACGACATPMPFGARFCPRCGQDRDASVLAGSVPCASCHAPVSTLARFCPRCGTPSAKDAASACARCKEPLDPAAKFCPACGCTVTDPSPATNERSP